MRTKEENRRLYKETMKKNRILCYIMVFMILLLGFMDAPKYAIAATNSLTAPTGVKAVSSSYSSITVSWSGVTGAVGYRVYRAASKTGSYTLIAVTTAKSYKSTRLITGKNYYYKIRAYKISGSSKVYGNYSAVASAKPVPSSPSSIKAASSTYTSIMVSWSGVSGASGYQIYRATSKTGTYYAKAATTAKSYKNSGLATGKTYYYKVRAYRVVGSSKIYGSFSTVISAKPIPSVPSSLKAHAISNNSIVISWNKVTGATGYRVYGALSKTGTYTRIADIKLLHYENTGLEAGSDYYYKVRAYTTIENSNVYSSYSPVVSATAAYIPVTEVSLDKSIDTLTLGEQDTLIATVFPAEATNQEVDWQSSDTGVITVDDTGIITTVGEGTADITVTTSDGSWSADCTVTVNNAKIKGIDVSKWQGTIKWTSVKNAGIQFAMLRSSYGSSSVDPTFETNYQQAKANGIAVGVYHYSYATTVATAAAEVNFLISNLKGKQFEYPICLDIENATQSSLSKDTLTKIALTYLEKLSDAGYYPMIYTNKDWFLYELDDSKLTAYNHWLAQWGTSITYTGNVGIWQYSSTGSVSGISGHVDLDTSFIDYEARIKSLHLNGF